MKIKSLLFFFGINFLLFAVQLFPQQQKLSIKEAINIALENNYEIRIAKSDASISDNNYSLGNAGFLPKVDVTGSRTQAVTAIQQEYASGQTVDRPGSRTSTTNAGVALSWTLFDGFKMFTSYSKLKEYKELGEIKLRSQIENSLLDVIKTYYDIVRQKYNYDVAKESVNISEERVKLAGEKLSVGSASNLDLLRAKVDLNADKSNLLNQEVILSSLKVTLNRLLSRNVALDFDVDEIIDVKEGLSFDQLKEAAFNNNADLLQAEKNKSISSFDVTLLRSDFFPKINLLGGYSYQRTQSEAGFFRINTNFGYNYGMNLTWNLFSGWTTRLQYENALITLDRDEIKLNSVKTTLESNLLIAYKNYEKNLEILKLEEENVSVAKENLELALEQLKLGSISPLEFREVQRNYISAQSRFSSAQYIAKMSESDLLKQSGSLIPQEI
ncbi:MAG: TolC family protein [Bacteroidota bacterium]